jgi:hypothetical protein
MGEGVKSIYELRYYYSDDDEDPERSYWSSLELAEQEAVRLQRHYRILVYSCNELQLDFPAHFDVDIVIPT